MSGPSESGDGGPPLSDTVSDAMPSGSVTCPMTLAHRCGFPGNPNDCVAPYHTVMAGSSAPIDPAMDSQRHNAAQATDKRGQ